MEEGGGAGRNIVVAEKGSFHNLKHTQSAIGSVKVAWFR